MTHTNAMIGSMIDDSICEDRVVRAAYSDMLDRELSADCDDTSDCGAWVEYYGTHEGRPWRIHLTR